VEFFRIFLLPFALVYGLITGLRNLLFDLHILPSERFGLPVISVGNLSAGGTGKTPHVEYLIRLLSDTYQVTTLSRGYGRKTRGFRLAGATDSADTLGDEPMQYFTKFKNISVCVDENRRHGIKNLQCLKHPVKVVLLDDAFQHRYVKAGISVLLTDYHHLYSQDYLLPVGRLRESKSGRRRADIIIVTKTPNVLSPIVKRNILAELKPYPHQKVYFSFIRYSELTALWGKPCQVKSGKKFNTILLFAGIANIYPLQDYLRNECNELVIMQFDDHHKYTEEDLHRIKQNFADIYSRNKLLVTTEKDAMRLLTPGLKELAKQLPVHYLPMEIDFHKEDKEAFDEQILSYVKRIK